MGTILFECPSTGSPVSTGVETEPISFCRLSKTWLELYCPLCGRVHGARIWLAPETFGFDEFRQGCRYPQGARINKQIVGTLAIPNASIG
jgi:hypothetical protein